MCYNKVAWRRKEIKTSVMQHGLRKKVKEEQGAIFHFVQTQMMKYLITDCEKRSQTHDVLGRQKHMKCNRRGVKKTEGFEGRDRGRHEQASKCQGEMNSWRRNLH